MQIIKHTPIKSASHPLPERSVITHTKHSPNTSNRGGHRLSGALGSCPSALPPGPAPALWDHEGWQHERRFSTVTMPQCSGVLPRAGRSIPGGGAGAVSEWWWRHACLIRAGPDITWCCCCAACGSHLPTCWHLTTPAPLQMACMHVLS